MGRRQRLRARHIGAVVPVGDQSTEDTMTRRQTRAERTQAARERASGHTPGCTCGVSPPANVNWYSIRNFVDQPNRAAIYIYEEIGYWGTNANEFVQQLNTLNVDLLDVHINSPGGEVDDGIAIFNALRQHRAQVTVYIDGLAASAASFIAMAGDEVLISEFAQVMIHDAMGIEFGNAAEMRAFADILDRYSDNIAGIYTQRAGGTAEQWREAMRVETWYTGAEAVTAGLADRVHDLVPDEDGDAERMVAARWDLSLYAFRHQGRTAAPAPQLPSNHGADPVAPVDTDSAEPAAAAEPVGVEAAQVDAEASDVPEVSRDEESDAGQGEETDDVTPEPVSEAVVDEPDAATDATGTPEPEPEPASDSDVGVTSVSEQESEPDSWADLTAALTAPPSPDDEFARLTEALKGA